MVRSKVPDAATLRQELLALLADEPRRTLVGTRARHALRVHLGATNRVASLILNKPR